MKAICLELKESEGDQLNGRKFDLIVCVSAYHHIEDIASITRILAFYLKPSGKLIVLDLMKDSTTCDKFYRKQCNKHNESCKDGFDPKEIEKIFLDTGILEDVKVEVAFNFKKFIEKGQKEYIIEYLIAKGKRLE
ncbi:hypothetical protein C1645_750388 [Glomus cerebriforme]|uniref:S-adenosyl-L-methionine-dependent methyltransferase n=1 Tax=Glomus cerebriforme TaxID=658196 RepID=A0A397TJ45_9GLOM|nr:hypothetical protein C1645_750388 [Glomus cerebriforme]